ncbi:MAG: CHASE2 domain-containing protein, partial [Candidatus Cloacimonetes bacterium]|nr:CHASE2 domain-containing protein [Candidatus Cloacimonadota bacterium]
MNEKNNREFNIIKLYKSWYVLLLFALILLFCTYLIVSSAFMEEMEYKLIDLRFKLAPIPARADSNIVIVTIDDGSLKFFSDNGISYPWPRSYYAHIVDYFSKAGADAVIFDMQFYEPDIDREETYSEETDGAFAESIRKAGNVFFSAQLSLDDRLDKSDLSRFSYENKDLIRSLPNFPGVNAPIDLFLETVKSVGIINVKPDKDGVIRRIPVFYSFRNKILKQLSFSVWLDKLSGNEDLVFSKNDLKIKNTAIPVDREKNYFVNWYGNAGKESSFRYYPFQAVISSAAAESRNLKPLIPPQNFKDKYIIIGATAAGLMDLKTTPQSENLPGMEIWATILSNLINEDFVHFVPELLEFLITFLIVFIILFSISHFSEKKSHLIIFLLLIITFALTFFFWIEFRIVLNFVLLITGFLLSYLFVIVISYLIEGKSKREIRKIFSRYLHPDVIEKLVEHPKQIEMGGEEITATVLFTDIADFTTFSETKEPKELITDLNIYLDKITELVLENHGLLDKYTGDGIMALFGVPISRKDHAYLACKMALEHRKFCESFDQNSLSIP